MNERYSLIASSLALALVGCAAPSPAAQKPLPPAPTSDARPNSAAPAATSNEEAATKAALAWLSLVDQEKYSESWDAAAPGFQQAVSREDWVNAVRTVRHPLGALRSRQLSSANYQTSLPGAPAGKYVVIQLHASFEQKPEAIETITPAQAPNGTWQVSGYYIK